MYKLLDHGVFRLEDRAYIPECEGNSDWSEYKEWLSEGNTPEPMDVIDHEAIEKLAFFNKEKAIALRIEEDYRLELADISDAEMVEVKDYLKAINPTSATKIIPVRPEIMSRYE